MQLSNRLSYDFDIVSKLQFHESGILVVKANAPLTDWRIKIGNFENGQLATEMANNNIDSLDICIRFVGDYPKRPPYVRVTSHKVLMAPEYHSIYNNERQSFTVDFWKTIWDPNMSVFEMIKHIKRSLQKSGYIDPSTLKVIKPAEKVSDRYIGSEKASELQKIQLERMKEKEKEANSKKRPAEPVMIEQPTHKYVDTGASSELQKLHLERIEREKQMRQQEKNGTKKLPEVKEQPFVDFPVNINTGSMQWDIIRERQEQKLRQAKEKEMLLAKDASEIVLAGVKVTNSTVMNAFPIPLEIQGLVFTYLPIKELQKIQTVCVAWYSSAWERANSVNLADQLFCERLGKRELDYYFTKIGAMKIAQLQLGPINFFPELKGLSNLRELVWALRKETQMSVLEKYSFPKLEKLKLSLSARHNQYELRYFRMEGEEEEQQQQEEEEDNSDDDDDEDDGQQNDEEGMDEERERHPDDEIVFDEPARRKKKKVEVKIPDSLLTRILKKFENLVAVSLPTQCPFDSKVFLSMSFLLSLELQGIKLKLSDYRNIGSCVQLTHLNLSHTDSFTTKALNEISGLSNITSLDLSESKKVTSWINLTHFKKLKELCLGGCENFNQFHNILASFPALESLIIPLTGEKSIECMKSIANCDNLTELDISTGRKFTGKHLEVITQLSKLKILNIGANMSLSSRDIQCLSKLTTLSHLSLPYCRLSDVSVVTTLPKLLIVDIRDNGVSSFNLANLASKLPNTYFQ